MTQRELRVMCAQLAERIRPYDPDLVVGIATGGADVAVAIAESLGGPRVAIVKSQRPGTLVKQSRPVAGMLAALPERLANHARWLEVEYRELAYYLHVRRHGSDQSEPQSRIVDPEALAETVAEASRVLVVDDTLDSGQTLRGVVDAVREANPAADVHTAVLATTWRRPPVHPDYVLKPRLLLRLPSSFDA
ncbi:phosphoribosyltransferase [uncultured Cellulomonas sp.]|uniref:phosphoribosyltransferase n=1 Tax=uncultured Cellulomonas sp. TaxID=189682 RepID=UPI0026206C4C|nr:phosphoribosyltransferase family protein [uncultured Cellulomonas sp.]